VPLANRLLFELISDYTVGDEREKIKNSFIKKVAGLVSPGTLTTIKPPFSIQRKVVGNKKRRAV